MKGRCERGQVWGAIHAVQFEKMVDSEAVEYPKQSFIAKGKGVGSGKARAAMCIGGERNGPPEDCGGLYGFHDLLEPKSEAAESARQVE